MTTDTCLPASVVLSNSGGAGGGLLEFHPSDPVRDRRPGNLAVEAKQVG